MEQHSSGELASDKGGARANVRHVVITVHGIRTFGAWQERLRNLLLARSQGIEVLTYRYGYFSSLAFLIPPLRWLTTLRFRRAFLQVAHQFPGARIDIVAHSFGTHLVGWGLAGIPRAKRRPVHTIILAGSVLKPDFPWGEMLDDGSVHRVMNECGIHDSILVLNQLVVLFTGMAGRLGFNGMTSERFRNNWYTFGHSDYFLKNGLPHDQFMEKRWVPVLLSDMLAPPVDERTGSALQGLLTFLLQNAEPIKVALYAAPFVALAITYYVLFTSEREARQLALARQLAAQAELLRTQEPRLLEPSTLIAIEAIRRLHSVETDRALRENLDILPRLHVFLKLREPVTRLALSPDRKFVAASSTDKTVRVWAFPDGREIAAFEHPAIVTNIAFSPDSHLLATGTDVGGVTLWELPVGKKLRSLAFRGPIDALEFNPDGGNMLVAGADGLHLWSLGAKPVERKLTSRPVIAATFRADGRFIATADLDDDTIRIWDLRNDHLALALPQTNAPHALAFSRDGRYLAAASGLANVRESHAIWLWDVQAAQRIARIPQDAYVRALAFNSDGSLFATVTDDGFARVWRSANGEPAGAVTHGAPYAITSIAWRASGQQLATAGTDDTARVWDIASGHEIARMAHGDTVNAVAFSADPPYVITGTGGPFPAWLERSVRIWEMPQSTERARIINPDGVDALAFSPNGSLVATGSDDGLVRLFRVTTNEELASFNHGSAVTAIAFDARGRWLASASAQRTFPTPQEDLTRLWDISSHKEILRISHKDLVRSVAVSPNGRYLATGGGGGITPKSKDTSMQVWSLPDGHPVANIVATSDVYDIVFSPDGKLGASLEQRGIVTLWRPGSGTVVARLDVGIRAQEIAFDHSGRRLAVAAHDSARIYDVRSLRELQRIPHNSFVNTLAFSTDDRYLATGDSGKSAHIWDLDTNREAARFRHDDIVSSVAFSPDGQLFATAGFDKTAHLWLWRPQDLINQACGRLTRGLTEEEWHQYLADEPQRDTCGNIQR